MANHPPLRWGILSTARVLRRFVPGLRACPRSQLLAVASRDAERAALCAARYGIPRHHGDYDALLLDPEIDAVYIALPNHLHVPLALRCAAAGKHVLCEKPLALEPADIDALRDAAARYGVHISEGFVHLHHPQARRLRAELADEAQGALGMLGTVRGGHGFSLRDPGNIRWRPEYGGGALWDVGCYPVSAFVYYVGRRPSEVCATAVYAESGVDATLSGWLRFGPGGPLGHFDCSMVAPLRPRLELAGDRAAVTLHEPFHADIDGRENGYTVQPHDLGAEPRVVRLPPTDPFACEIQAMEAAVLDGVPLPLSLGFSMDVAVTLSALHASAREGRPVTLPL